MKWSSGKFYMLVVILNVGLIILGFYLVFFTPHGFHACSDAELALNQTVIRHERWLICR